VCRVLSPVLSPVYVSFRQIRAPVPPFPPVGPVAAPCGSPAVPSQVLRVRKTAPPSICGRLWSPWADAFPLLRAEMVSSPGFLGNPLEACPELGTPATPARPRNSGRPDAAFRLVNGVGIATSRVFGAESSRPASLLCTLRTHQSPGEWQHSLPACMLALAVRDLHPLDSFKGFHRLIFGSSSSKLFPAR
jgi:hypothetical protein